jgi:hypothetical protein
VEMIKSGRVKKFRKIGEFCSALDSQRFDVDLDLNPVPTFYFDDPSLKQNLGVHNRIAAKLFSLSFL